MHAKSRWKKEVELVLHLVADFDDEGGLALELGGKGLDGAEGGGADVVLHAFDIVVDDLVVRPKSLKKSVRS